MGSRDNLPRQQVPTEGSGTWLRFGEHDVEIEEGETLIGRSPKCRVVFDDPLVSRTHARIFSSRGVVTIEDLKSQNGILVNGEPVVRPRVLQSGDRVIIGQQSFVLYVAVKTEPPPSSREQEVVSSPPSPEFVVRPAPYGICCR